MISVERARVYRMADIFFGSWHQMPADIAAAVLSRLTDYEHAKAESRGIDAGTHLTILTGLLARRRKLWMQLTSVQLVQALQDMTWLRQPWYDFHVTWIKTRRGRIVAPDTKLHDMTFWQLAWADAEYSRYLQLVWGRSKDARTAMKRLTAVLYRYEGDGGVKRPFAEDDIMKTVMAMPDIGPKLEYLILRTYANCRAYLAKRCPTLMPQRSAPDGDAAAPQYTGQMWQAAVMDLADMPAYQSIDRAKAAPVYEALDYLEKKAKEAEEMKRKYAKQ